MQIFLHDQDLCTDIVKDAHVFWISLVKDAHCQRCTLSYMVKDAYCLLDKDDNNKKSECLLQFNTYSLFICLDKDDNKKSECLLEFNILSLYE